MRIGSRLRLAADLLFKTERYDQETKIYEVVSVLEIPTVSEMEIVIITHELHTITHELHTKNGMEKEHIDWLIAAMCRGLAEYDGNEIVPAERDSKRDCTD